MRGVALCGIVLSGCILYSDGEGDVPWPEGDGPGDGAIDAPIDVPMDCGCIDAPMITNGRIMLYEVDHLDPASDGSLGQGLFAEVTFPAPVGTLQPIAEEQPGSPLGCKVWRYSRDQAIASRGINEGTVELVLPGLPSQPVGACTHDSSGGYVCPGTGDIHAALADPGVLPDNQAIEVRLIQGGFGDIMSFMSAANDIGDDFTLPPADVARMENMPRDGAAFSIGCDSALCNSGATATELEILTTDAPVTGLPPFAMPLPNGSRTVLRCAAIGTPTITVPSGLAQFIMTSGATRIQTTYRRGRFVATPMGIVSLSGHAISGVSD